MSSQLASQKDTPTGDLSALTYDTLGGSALAQFWHESAAKGGPGWVDFDKDLQTAALANRGDLGDLLPKLPTGLEFAHSTDVTYKSPLADPDGQDALFYSTGEYHTVLAHQQCTHITLHSCRGSTRGQRRHSQYGRRDADLQHGIRSTQRRDILVHLGHYAQDSASRGTALRCSASRGTASKPALGLHLPDRPVLLLSSSRGPSARNEPG